MGCEKEPYNNELAFEWRKQPMSNLRDIAQIVKYIRNDIERQNILAKMPLQKSSLTIHPGMYFCWGKRSYVELVLGMNSVAASRNVEVERH